MEQNSETNQKTSVNESFQDFYYSFIDQLPQIGLGLMIIILGVLLGIWVGRFVKSRISARTKDPLQLR